MKFVTTYRLESETQRKLRRLSRELELSMDELFLLLMEKFEEVTADDRENETV